MPVINKIFWTEYKSHLYVKRLSAKFQAIAVQDRKKLLGPFHEGQLTEPTFPIQLKQIPELHKWGPAKRFFFYLRFSGCAAQDFGLEKKLTVDKALLRRKE